MKKNLFPALIMLVFFLSSCANQLSDSASKTDQAEKVQAGDYDQSSHLPWVNGYHWVKVHALCDEFNGNKLDSNKWLNYHPYWKGRSPSIYRKKNVSVYGGKLRLKCTVRNYQKKGDWVWASCVTSRTKVMRAGYYSEARIKCPKISMTGAFWFQGKYSEIDVIENFGAPTNYKYKHHHSHMKTNTHYYINGWPNDKKTPWEKSILFPSCGDAYHVYGVWWKDKRTVIFYLNGKPVHTAKTGGNFNENMYMFFDTETFYWMGLPTIKSLDDHSKNTQYVDWVRTYRLVKN